jgi:oligoribonuclease
MTKDERLTDSRFLWTDIEATGLTDSADPGSLYHGGELLEVCLLLTDHTLEYLDHRSVVIHHDPRVLRRLRATVLPVVEEMHTRNGLWDASARYGLFTLDGPGGLTTEEAEDTLTAWLTQWDVTPKTLPMCGSSVHTDREWLRERLPGVHSWFGYRNIDVSTVMELAKRWYPGGRLPQQPPREEHRAYPDLLDTLDKLRHYRNAVFQPIIPVPAAAEA